MLGADLGIRAVSRYRQQDDDDGRRGEQTTAPWPRVGAGRTGPGMAFLLPSPAVTTGSRVRAMVAVELLPCLCGTRKLLRTDAAGVRFGCQPWRGSMDRARVGRVQSPPRRSGALPPEVSDPQSQCGPQGRPGPQENLGTGTPSPATSHLPVSRACSCGRVLGVYISATCLGVERPPSRSGCGNGVVSDIMDIAVLEMSPNRECFLRSRPRYVQLALEIALPVSEILNAARLPDSECEEPHESRIRSSAGGQQ